MGKLDRLLHDLFRELKKDIIPFPDRQRVKLDIIKYGDYNTCRTIRGDNYKIEKILIILRLESISIRAKKGYPDDYYNGRHNKLNFIIGNRHLALRFVLLHELYHSWQRLQNANISEKDADDYAIKKLRG